MHPDAINRVSTVHQQPGKTRSDFTNGFICMILALGCLRVFIPLPWRGGRRPGWSEYVVIIIKYTDPSGFFHFNLRCMRWFIEYFALTGR